MEGKSEEELPVKGGERKENILLKSIPSPPMGEERVMGIRGEDG